MAKSLKTPLCILSYPRLDKPTPGEDGKPDKYSAALVFAPRWGDRDLLLDPAERKLLDELQAASIEVIQEKFGTNAAKMMNRESFKKGFRKDIEGKGYPEGSIYINARNERKPGIVYPWAGADGRPERMADEDIKEKMHAGVIVRASVTPFAFDRPDNKGLSFALNNLQFIANGPRLDGYAAAEDEFKVDLSAAPASLDDLNGDE